MFLSNFSISICYYKHIVFRSLSSKEVKRMKHKLKILHTADLHLGTPFRFLNLAKQLSMQAEQERLFFKIIRLAEQEEVDFLIIAGDLFDSINPDKYLLKKIKEGLASIAQIDIIINPGNHDYWCPQGIWQSLSSLDHIHVFNPENSFFKFPQKGITFHGKPFLSQSSPKSLWRDEFPNLEAGFKNILVQHGDFQITNSNYNPIPSYWIDQSKFDFALLGHIHNSKGIIYTDDRVPCLYCGCPQGRGFDETGTKGIYLLELDDSKKTFRDQVKFISLNGAKFYNIPVLLSKAAYHALANQFEIQDQIIIDLSQALASVNNYKEFAEEAMSLGYISNKKNKNNKQEAKEFLLAHIGTFDCCKLRLEGNTQAKINCELLDQRLSEYFFHTEIKDNTRIEIDFDLLVKEHSLRGDVARHAKRLATQPDLLNQAFEKIGLENLKMQEAKNILEQAFYFTIQAAEQDLDIYEN